MQIEKSRDGVAGGWKLRGVKLIANGRQIYARDGIERWLEDDHRTWRAPDFRRSAPSGPALGVSIDLWDDDPLIYGSDDHGDLDPFDRRRAFALNYAPGGVVQRRTTGGSTLGGRLGDGDKASVVYRLDTLTPVAPPPPPPVVVEQPPAEKPPPPPPPAPKPDLVISDMDFNTTDLYYFTVRNQGAAAAGPFSVDVPGYGTFAFSGLAAGASATRTYDTTCHTGTRQARADSRRPGRRERREQQHTQLHRRRLHRLKISPRRRRTSAPAHRPGAAILILVVAMRTRRHEPSVDAAPLVGVGLDALVRAPEDTTSTVLRVVLDRVAAGSRPGARDDDHVVCLAVEGGGMRGAVSAGMCVVLEAAGAVGAFDRIYGVSAGALNAWATAAGQAALSATHYQDAVSRRVIDRTGPLRGRPVIDFELLFEELIGTRKPLSFERLSAGPEFRALATSLETMSLRVLQGFADAEEVRQAVRASASLPRLGGEPPVFRGERMTDGALVEPIPFETALAEGATHVLVLRSCSAACRKPALAALGERLALREDRRLFELARERQGKYNRQAAALQNGTLDDAGAQVDQVTVPHGTRLIGRLEPDPARVVQALRLGAAAMASTLLTDAISLCWQPVVYRAGPLALAPAEAPAVAAAHAARWRPRARRANGWSAAS